MNQNIKIKSPARSKKVKPIKKPALSAGKKQYVANVEKSRKATIKKCEMVIREIRATGTTLLEALEHKKLSQRAFYDCLALDPWLSEQYQTCRQEIVPMILSRIQDKLLRILEDPATPHNSDRIAAAKVLLNRIAPVAKEVNINLVNKMTDQAILDELRDIGRILDGNETAAPALIPVDIIQEDVEESE